MRDGRGRWAWLSGLQLGVGRDIRDGIRSLAKRPVFTAVAILSLALGIGANTAIFSLVNAVILRDSPIERPEEVVNLYLHQAAFEFGTLSYPDFEDVRDGTAEVFSDIAASHFVPLTIDRGEGGGLGLAPAEAVTGSYFPMLGIEAAVGRTLLPSDDVSRGGHPVVMLDYRYWQSAFSAGSRTNYLYHNSDARPRRRHRRDPLVLSAPERPLEPRPPFERLLVDTVVCPDPAAVSWINPRLQPGEERRVMTGIPGKTGVV